MYRVLGSIVLTALVLGLVACEDPPPQGAPGEPSLRSIVECGSGALTGPLLDNPNALQHAAAVYEAVDDGTDVLAALEAVFGRPVEEFDDAQIDEALFILAGLEACGEISPTLRESAIGAIGILRSLVGSPPPDDGSTGRALCPESSPFAPPAEQRFEPDCGPSIEGDWVLERTTTECVNFVEGCGDTPITIRIADCAESTCTVSRTDGVWTSDHALERTANGLGGDFEDVGIACEGTRNPADLTLVLTVVSADGDRSTGLAGTYEVSAATNPPSCAADAYAAYDVVGRR